MVSTFQPTVRIEIQPLQSCKACARIRTYTRSIMNRVRTNDTIAYMCFSSLVRRAAASRAARIANINKAIIRKELLFR